MRNLTCEFLNNPLGLDTENPRLSWQMHSHAHGVRQKAYRVIVASSLELLESEKGDLWDSGKVESSQSVLVEYCGMPLKSRTVCYWKVRVWNQNNRISTWSKPAMWTTGLLCSHDWKGEWIGLNSGKSSAIESREQWIWSSKNDMGSDCRFRRTIELPPDRRVIRAFSQVEATGGFPVFVNGRQIGFKTTEDITGFIHAGKNVIAIEVGALYRPSGLIGGFWFEFDAGEPMVVVTNGQWRAKCGKTEGWELPSFDDSDWPPAHIVKAAKGKPWEELAEYLRPTPWLRSSFVLEELPDKAFVHVTALGYYELYINGHKVDDHVLSPAVSQYDERAWYITHDVKKHLNKGKNCIAFWIAHGWYRKGLAGVFHPGPLVKAQLEIHDRHDWRIVAKTDRHWKASPSHIIHTGNWKCAQSGGEIIDNRLFVPQWNDVNFDDARWKNAVVCVVDKIKISAQPVEPNRIQRIISPTQIQLLDNGEWLVDMGTNLTGWFEMKLSGLIAGQSVKFRYFDTLDDNANDGYGQLDAYISSGRGEDSFCNHFSYHGFRYVKVKGLSAAPVKKDIRAYLIHTDFAAAGRFKCSSKLLNNICDMIEYTLRCLSIGGIFMDCPHRERLGYGGDGQSSMESIMMMFQPIPLLKNWTAAWLDSQRADGDMPHTAPNPYRAGGGPVWCGFLLTSTYYCYLYYGDRQMVSKNYPAIKKWLRFVESHCVDNILRQWPSTDYRNWCLGDWAVPDDINQNDPQSIDLINNCFRIYCYELAAELAEALNKKADCREFRRLMTAARTAVHNTFFNPVNNAYADGDQIDLAFPLLTGVVPEALRGTVMKKLEDEISVKHNSHFAVGLVGVYFLQKQLLASGRNDLMFAMLSQVTQPGYGYMLRKGATTTWEYWNGKRSHIHNCYNAIGVWFYQGLAGIRPDPASPGFSNILIKPAIVGNLKYVDASFKSPYGTVHVEWHLKRGYIELKITVPANAAATVYVPTTDARQIKEKLSGSETFCRQLAENSAVFQISAGNYIFISPWSK